MSRASGWIRQSLEYYAHPRKGKLIQIKQIAFMVAKCISGVSQIKMSNVRRKEELRAGPLQPEYLVYAPDSACWIPV